MSSVVQDLRYALRGLRKSPVFASVAIVTLALGIGANTAIFSVLDPLLLRVLPVYEPDRLVALTDPETNGFRNGLQTGVRSLMAYSEFETIRDRNQVFSGVFASSGVSVKRDVVIKGQPGGESETASLKLVSGGYFQTLGVAPVAGRVFGSEVDRRQGDAPVAVISNGYWQSRFGGAADAVGRVFYVNRQAFEIVGVMPMGFFGETVGVSPDIWVPLSMQSAIHPGKDFLSPHPDRMDKMMWLQVFGRLKPSVTTGEAAANVNVVFRTMLEAETSNPALIEYREKLLDQRVELKDAARGGSVLRGSLSSPVQAVMALVGVVLLIACGNLANLLLARARARRREVSLRLALGASRTRLLRQFLTEGLVLSLLGGGVGLLLSPWLQSLFLYGSEGESLSGSFSSLTGRVLIFSLMVSILSGLLFGSAPAIRGSRADLASTLRFSGSGDAGDGRYRAGKLLVMAQVGLSLLLVVTAGLFLRSLHNVTVEETGFDPDHLVEFSLDPAVKGYAGPRLASFYRELQERVAGLPGVVHVSFSDNGIFSRSDSVDPIEVEGYEAKPDEALRARYDHVGPGYFAATGIPLLAGRDISPADAFVQPRPAVINETMARLYFGEGSPLGRKFRNSHPENPGDFEVVGLASDSKHNSLREPKRARYYLPFFNPIYEVGEANFLVRFSGDVDPVAAGVREVVRDLDPDLAKVEFQYLPEAIDNSLRRDRLIARIASFFGLLALFLASIGIYGVIGYDVIRRSREIGVRMAIGASRVDVSRMVLADSGKVLLPGLVIGFLAAMGTSKFLSGLLFETSAVDPLVIAVSALTMVAAGLLASYVPAHRASRLDPTVVLRMD